MRALRERVDELSQVVEQARNAGAPPPDAPPPVVAYAPPPAPAPTVVVTVVNQPAQPPEPDYASSGCDYTLGGCGFFFPGYTYVAPSFPRGFHKPQHHRNRGKPMRPSFGLTQPLANPLVPSLIPNSTRPQHAPGRRLG
jgi:hypothetical protein